MQLTKETCTGCGYCILVCPYDALKSNGWAEVIPENCTDCNLCVYACPSDCFVPDVPLKPYKPHLKSNYDVVIIGSGIGGLMTGVALAQAGRSVAVFEKLGFPGGRYTEIDYKGAPVTTGAWTNLGPNSHIGRFLTDHGINIDYTSLEDLGLIEQYTIRFPDGRHYAGLFDLLTPEARKTWLKAMLAGKRQLKKDQNGSFPTFLDKTSIIDYLAEFDSDPDLLATIDAISTTMSGVGSEAMPASEYLQIALDSRDVGRQFAMPKGGVRTIIKALVTALRQAGGSLFVRSPVEKILLENDKATGIQLEDGRQVSAQVIVNNAGPRRFVKMIGPQNLPKVYLDQLADLKSAECGALFCATREPLFADAPIMMTPDSQRVVGIFAPTLFDPALSKDGLYLFDAFFPVHQGDRTAELELVLEDMRRLFPQFDDTLVWQVPMFFVGNWPGTESGQTFGQTGNQRLDPVTPIENCFLVGLDVKGSGVAGDLIPIGVRQALKYLEEQALWN